MLDRCRNEAAVVELVTYVSKGTDTRDNGCLWIRSPVSSVADVAILDLRRTDRKFVVTEVTSCSPQECTKPFVLEGLDVKRETLGESLSDSSKYCVICPLRPVCNTLGSRCACYRNRVLASGYQGPTPPA
jgi:hypothetical protein